MIARIKNHIILSALLATFVFLGISLAPFKAQALTIENLNLTTVDGDFVVGPGKTEMTLKPGESKTVNLLVTNRTGVDKVFNLSVEDFTGSNDPQLTVVLLGDDRGPYSLKDYIHFEDKSFVLKHGERARVPVTVSIPTDAEPGGLFGSVIVSTASVPGKNEGAGAMAVVSRIGALFFVTVPGEAAHDAKLQSFTLSTKSKIFSKPPIGFRILFENKGSIHVNPYGQVSISNMFGQNVGNIEIQPWFVLPASVRLREVSFNPPILFGRYTAHLSVNRGYGDIVDEASVSFYVLPWKWVLGLFGIILIVIFGIRFITRKFEIRRK